jgi:hypothetical protein
VRRTRERHTITRKYVSTHLGLFPLCPAAPRTAPPAGCPLTVSGLKARGRFPPLRGFPPPCCSLAHPKRGDARHVHGSLREQPRWRRLRRRPRLRRRRRPQQPARVAVRRPSTRPLLPRLAQLVQAAALGRGLVALLLAGNAAPRRQSQVARMQLLQPVQLRRRGATPQRRRGVRPLPASVAQPS